MLVYEPVVWHGGRRARRTDRGRSARYHKTLAELGRRLKTSRLAPAAASWATLTLKGHLHGEQSGHVWRGRRFSRRAGWRDSRPRAAPAGGRRRRGCYPRSGVVQPDLDHRFTRAAAAAFLQEAQERLNTLSHCRRSLDASATESPKYVALWLTARHRQLDEVKRSLHAAAACITRCPRSDPAHQGAGAAPGRRVKACHLGHPGFDRRQLVDSREADIVPSTVSRTPGAALVAD